MIINLIRHGDPDYDLDRLTLNGQNQASLLAKSLAGECQGEIYSSPLGRSLETAQALAKLSNYPITVLDFLREMDDVTVWDKTNPELAVWNISPTFLRDLQSFNEIEKNGGALEFFKKTKLFSRLEEINLGMIALLNKYGLEYSEGTFRLLDKTKQRDNIYLFGHYGCYMAIIAFLCQIDILDVWRTVFLDTSSITRLLIEDLGEGKLNFRVLTLGDTAHLYANKLKPSRNGLQYNNC